MAFLRLLLGITTPDHQRKTGIREKFHVWNVTYKNNNYKNNWQELITDRISKQALGQDERVLDAQMGSPTMNRTCNFA
jgi:hypothetical protein